MNKISEFLPPEYWDENQPGYKESRKKVFNKFLSEIDMNLLGRLFQNAKYVLEDLPNTEYFLLHLEYEEPNSDSKELKMFKCETRKWLIHQGFAGYDFIRTCFEVLKTSAEHRIGEHFQWREDKPYSPHRALDETSTINMYHKFSKRVSDGIWKLRDDKIISDEVACSILFDLSKEDECKK